jgi:hypothetical protein
MRFALVGVALVAACYQPTLHEGAPCGPGATCPTGQECRAGTCFFTTTPADASSSDTLDLDASMITTDAPLDGAPYVPWGTPVEITSLEIAQDGEDDPTISADRKTAVVSARETTGTLDRNLFIGTRSSASGSFTVIPLTVLNSTAEDVSPEISPDGMTLYFMSERTTAGNGDVWKSTLTNGIWAAPTMDADLSTGDVNDFAISPDELTALVARSGTFYLHTRASTSDAWGTGAVHNELLGTSLVSVTAPTITNGAQIVYFHAGTEREIYTSHRLPNGIFDVPTAVTELDATGLRDAAPFVLQTDDYMIFERDYDIFETTR